MSKSETLEAEVDKLSNDKSLDLMVKDSRRLLNNLKKFKKKIANSENDANLKSISSEITGEENAWHDRTSRRERKAKRSLRNYTEKCKGIFTVDMEECFHLDKIKLEPRSKPLIDKLVAIDLLRKGQFELSSQVCKIDDLGISSQLLDDMKTMRIIIDEIQDRFELTTAIKWAKSHSKDLAMINSDLEFKLCKAQYLKVLLEQGDIHGAMEFARKELSKYGKTHFTTITKLFEPLLTKQEGYAQLTDVLKSDLCNELAQAYSTLEGITVRSPLTSALFAGYLAIPAFEKFNKIKSRTGDYAWNSSDELPFEVQMPKWLMFHPIFICPVSREEASTENPPMVLPCGHIISESSLNQLSHQGRVNFKCPYCPQTSLHQEKKAKFIGI